MWNDQLASPGWIQHGKQCVFQLLRPGTQHEAMLLSPNLWPSDPSVNRAQHQMEAISQLLHQIPLDYQSTGKPSKGELIIS
jgi:hypothetical protein